MGVAMARLHRDSVLTIERDNPSLKDVRLGQLIGLVGKIGLGDGAVRFGDRR